MSLHFLGPHVGGPPDHTHHQRRVRRPDPVERGNEEFYNKLGNWYAFQLGRPPRVPALSLTVVAPRFVLIISM